MKKIILITTGDMKGIGIEILLKIWKTNKNNKFILLTSINLLKKYLVKKKFDCFIFNYHDQALIPFKIFSKNNGINFTSGIDIIRVSPDHGTGYDIVGKNIAKITGLINCFKFIDKIYTNKK